MTHARLRSAVVFALITLFLGAGSPTTSASGADRLGQLTRAFAELDVRDMDGRRWTAASLRGRVVVLDFWATWCAPCWQEIPWLQKIHKASDPGRVQVIGVTLDVTDRRSLISWMNRRRVDWPQIRESNGYEGVLAEQFGVASLPTTVLVGPDGRALALNLRGARLVAAVKEALR
jgi:thiol-disulfide isomerase/thioredoxin